MKNVQPALMTWFQYLDVDVDVDASHPVSILHVNLQPKFCHIKKKKNNITYSPK